MACSDSRVCIDLITQSDPGVSSYDATPAREVLQMLTEGKVAKEIAGELDISVYTVDAHRGRIMKKLSLKSSTEIVRFAMRKGLIQ